MKIMTFGCRLNIFESAVIQQIVGDVEGIILFNTCAVTGEAERQCRQAIRKAHRDFPDMKIIVTGCAAQLFPEKYASMPEVWRVLGNRDKLLKQSYEVQDEVLVSPLDDFEIPVVSDFEGRTRAFLQIQQGCSNACTFCIVRFARGKNKGLDPDQVILEAKKFVAEGFQELVLTGVDITSYPYGFEQIIRRILVEVPHLKRLRLGSLDPASLTDSLIDMVVEFPAFMPHFHLSMQSGDDLVLKRMGRRHKSSAVIKWCNRLLDRVPEAVLGGDFITGFPTETDEMFINTMDFVKMAKLTHLHVFPYSVREGTPAAKMPMVDMSVRKNRASRLRELGDLLLQNRLDSFVGKTMPVLIENHGVGYTENYLKVKTNSFIMGKIVPVLITERNGNELVGKA